MEALKAQCNSLEETISSFNSKFVEYAKKAEDKNQMIFLTEDNTFKRKSEEKAGLLVDLKKRIFEVEERKESFR